MELGGEFPLELGARSAGPAVPPSPRAPAYARQLAQLVPPGLLWKLEPGSWLSSLLLGMADEPARIDDRGQALVDEWDPRTALETLEDWERVLGLPDDIEAPDTIAGRQAACVRKYVARGGATAAYFIGLAALMGFVATIDEPSAHTWRMTVDLSASTSEYAPGSFEFRAGSARAGDRIGGRTVASFERVINRVKPAHTVCLFVYTS